MTDVKGKVHLLYHVSLCIQYLGCNMKHGHLLQNPNYGNMMIENDQVIH